MCTKQNRASRQAAQSSRNHLPHVYTPHMSPRANAADSNQLFNKELMSIRVEGIVILNVWTCYVGRTIAKRSMSFQMISYRQKTQTRSYIFTANVHRVLFIGSSVPHSNLHLSTCAEARPLSSWRGSIGFWKYLSPKRMHPSNLRCIVACQNVGNTRPSMQLDCG